MCSALFVGPTGAVNGPHERCSRPPDGAANPPQPRAGLATRQALAGDGSPWGRGPVPPHRDHGHPLPMERPLAPLHLAVRPAHGRLGPPGGRLVVRPPHGRLKRCQLLLAALQPDRQLFPQSIDGTLQLSHRAAAGLHGEGRELAACTQSVGLMMLCRPPPCCRLSALLPVGKWGSLDQAGHRVGGGCREGGPRGVVWGRPACCSRCCGPTQHPPKHQMGVEVCVLWPCFVRLMRH